jgi:hypothetical protein
MKALRAASIGALLITLGTALLAQPAPTAIVTHDFEGTDHGWQSMGATGRVSLTTAEGTFKTGKSALKFEYLVEAGEMSALMLPIAQAPPKEMKSISFWVKSPAAMALLVVLQERGGGRFQSVVAVPADKWQRVELALSDFTLGKDKDDPADANGKLDIDQLEAVALADLAQMLAGVAEPEMLSMLGLKTGARVFYVDDITASTTALPVPAAQPGELVIDAFMRPHIGWFVAGTVKAEVTSDKPLEGKGIRMEYNLGEGKIAAAMKGLPEGMLAQCDKLLLSLASERPTTVLVQLEEASGGKYNTVVTLEGEKKLRKLTLPFAEFTQADDSKDDNGRLDKGTVKQIIIADLSFMAGGGSANTLWLGAVRAAKAP